MAHANAPAVSQSLCYGEKPSPGTPGVHLFFRRLSDRAARAALLAVARAEATPAARRKAFVVGCLCTPDGTPQLLPPGETAKLDAMSLDEWDECITKAAHLNGFAALRILAD